MDDAIKELGENAGRTSNHVSRKDAGITKSLWHIKSKYTASGKEPLLTCYEIIVIY